MTITNSINFNSSTPASASVGGSGVSGPTANGILIANGTSPFSSQLLTDGQVLIGSTGLAPVAAALTAGSGITITPGAGSISIASSVAAFNPANDYTITGVWDFTNELSINVVENLLIKAANTKYILLTNVDPTPAAPEPDALGIIGVNNVYLGTSAVAATTSVYSQFGQISISGVSIGAIASGSNAELTSADGSFFIDSASVIMKNTAATSFFKVDLASGNISGEGDTVSFTSTGADVTLTADQNVNVTATNGQVFIEATGDSVNITTGADFVINGLNSSGAGDSLLTFNSGTGEVFSGPAAVIMRSSVVAGASVSVSPGTKYVHTFAGAVSFALPTTAAVGSVFQIVGGNTGSWTITQAAGQSVRLGNVVSTTGVGGSVASTLNSDCVFVECIVANTTFVISSAVGNPNLT